MRKRLLIVTPYKSFGELIISSLDGEEFSTVLADTPENALASGEIDLALLDADTQGITLNDLHQALLEKSPGLGTLIVHSINQPVPFHQDQQDRIHLLARPFDLSELLQSLDQLTVQPSSPGSQPTPSTMIQASNPTADIWLTDTKTVQRRLLDSIYSPLIREALLFSSGRIINSTFEPGRDSTYLLEEMTEQQINQDQVGVQVRFLEMDGSRYLFYMAPFAGLMSLALLFDPAVRFSLAKKMFNKFAAKLARNSELEIDENLSIPVEAGGIAESQLPKGVGIVTTSDEIQSGSSLSAGWIPAVNLNLDDTSPQNIQETVYPWDEAYDSGKQSLPGSKAGMDPQGFGHPEIQITNQETGGQAVQNATAGINTVSPEEDTQPVKVNLISTEGLEECNFPTPESNLWQMVSYSFLMISKYPNYRLEDESARIVDDEIRSICRDNGWRLLFLEIHTDYIQLSVNVPEMLPPALILKLIRQRTTNVLLQGFTEVEQELVEGDFWESAQLITAGSQPEIF